MQLRSRGSSQFRRHMRKLALQTLEGSSMRGRGWRKCSEAATHSEGATHSEEGSTWGIFSHNSWVVVELLGRDSQDNLDLQPDRLHQNSKPPRVRISSLGSIYHCRKPPPEQKFASAIEDLEGAIGAEEHHLAPPRDALHAMARECRPREVR